MQVVEFRATVKDGSIKIPRKYLRDLTTRVRVILLAEKSAKSTVNLVDQLLAHPVRVKGFCPLTREQIYPVNASSN
jgi:hypothetical protein